MLRSSAFGYFFLILASGVCHARLGYASIALNYNWNGLAHATNVNPDDPNGFRTISDRALTAGITTNSLGGLLFTVTSGTRTYELVRDPNALDLVFVGQREAGNGFFGWDGVANGDRYGIAPTWDPTGGTGYLASASTILAHPTTALDNAFEIGFLYNSSVGGGNVNVTLGFTDGSSITATLHAPDWFADFNGTPLPPAAGVATQALLAGPLSGGDGFDATQLTDFALPGPPLNVVEATLTQSSLLAGLGFDVTGRQLNSITFDDAFRIQNGFDTAFGFYAAYTNASIVPEPSSFIVWLALPLGLMVARRRARTRSSRVRKDAAQAVICQIRR